MSENSGIEQGLYCAAPWPTNILIPSMIFYWEYNTKIIFHVLTIKDNYQSLCSIECTPQRYFEMVPFSLLDDLSVYVEDEEASDATK